MANCYNCGRVLAPGTRACPHCGYDGTWSPLFGMPDQVEQVTSFTRAGLLTGVITVLLFLKINYWALPFLGITCGLAMRSYKRCIAGFVISLCLGLFLAMPVLSRHPMLSTGLFSELPAYMYTGWLRGALIGATLQVPHRRLMWIALVGAIFHSVNFELVAVAIRVYYPGLGNNWDYLILMLTIPAFGLGIWFPVDIMNQKLWKLRWQREL